MAEPIVFISRFRLRPGAADAFANAYADVVGPIAASKPRTATFVAYVDADGSEVRIVHTFPDADAMSAHFEGSDERTNSIADLVEPAGFEVFGPAPTGAVDQLRREAAEAGVELSVFPRSLGGFLRAPA
jgi:quinol monooxygenase YgiN